MSYPILVPSSSYTADTTYRLDVYYMFPEDHPAKDYTVRVYSKQTLTVLDSNDEARELHMDGTTEPSGFGTFVADPVAIEEPATTEDDYNPWEDEGIVAADSLWDTTSIQQLLVT